MDVATYSVGELSSTVAKVINRAFPEELWVHGEIRDLKRPANGHVFFSLVDPDDEQAATIPVALFATDRTVVNRVLVRSGAVRMTDGIHVRIRGRVVHYARQGTVQLRMTWIDTDYTVGRLAARRRALLDALAASGHLARNQMLSMPPVPLRVGLVTSVGSAAHADFLDELGGSGFRFVVSVVDARVQGTEAPSSIAGAIARLDRCEVDVVALVRGGGAQTDLAAFDSEEVALAIATARHPVFVGVGHEIDTTVADHVAARSVKTPTACAAEIVQTVAVFEARLGELARWLRRAVPAAALRAESGVAAVEARVLRWRVTLDGHAAVLDRFTRRLIGLSSRMVERATADIEASARRSRSVAGRSLYEGTRRLAASNRRLPVAAGLALGRHERNLDSFDAVRRAVEPQRMLARGWSVTRSAHGRLVRGPGEVHDGDVLRTLTVGGEIVSTVGADDRSGDMT